MAKMTLESEVSFRDIDSLTRPRNQRSSNTPLSQDELKRQLFEKGLRALQEDYEQAPEGKVHSSGPVSVLPGPEYADRPHHIER